MSNITYPTIPPHTLYKPTISTPSPHSPVPESSKSKPHHLKNGSGYTNPWESWVEKSVPGMGLAMMRAKLTGNFPTPDTTPPTVPHQTPTFLPTRHSSPHLRATWLGHATYYLEYSSGLRVLFDPVFEDRCSPFTFLGPKRYTRPPPSTKGAPSGAHGAYPRAGNPSGSAATRGTRAVPPLPKDIDDYDDAYAHLPVCPAFREIGELRGPFDLGLVPIGAYEPRSIFSPMHANPFDSVNIFLDTQCKRAMGIHWGTWVLTSEAVMEPPRLLRKALAWKGLPETGVF
ncbi:hypothetical protein EYC84_009881 [Monilinia fructicola]|uniref:Metallo-beta-lactamase domain-containing protein n=1 Tax=Monilinia fructicola TaxID=38448 RepID=A0A5M9JBY5_MONFR|nr:hypothetical protein EYC84_009881 [Monilinia fructicola]